jgi:hypothetical protein
MTVCNARVRAAATDSGWSSGITPLPIGERRNGICVRSIKVRTSSSARDQAMPLADKNERPLGPLEHVERALHPDGDESANSGHNALLTSFSDKRMTRLV